MTTSSPTLLLVAASILAVPASAQLEVYDAGVVGNPPLAPDPVTQGFGLDDGGGGVIVQPISPDPGTGLNAWEVSDSVTGQGGYAFYHVYPSIGWNPFRQFVAGTWELTATMRMTAGPTDTIFIEVSTGFTVVDTQYRLFFRIAGVDVIVENPLTGQSYTCVGGALGDYHSFTIRKTIPIEYAPAEVLYDGVLLGPLNEVFPQFVTYYGVLFGSHQDGGVGRARFHRVELRALSDVGTSYCGPATVNSTGSAGSITGYGSTYRNQNLLELTAASLPPGEFGYFLTSQTQGFFMPPNSQGNICLAGDIGRYNGSVGTGPSFTLQIDLGSMPVNPSQSVLPGDTWNFQAWYRDVGGANNFTDGLSVTFR